MKSLSDELIAKAAYGPRRVCFIAVPLVKPKEILDTRQEIGLLDGVSVNRSPIEHCNVLLQLRNRVAEQFYFFRARFEDRLEIVRVQSQEKSRSEGGQSYILRRIPVKVRVPRMSPQVRAS